MKFEEIFKRITNAMLIFALTALLISSLSYIVYKEFGYRVVTIKNLSDKSVEISYRDFSTKIEAYKSKEIIHLNKWGEFEFFKPVSCEATFDYTDGKTSVYLSKKP